MENTEYDCKTIFRKLHCRCCHTKQSYLGLLLECKTLLFFLPSTEGSSQAWEAKHLDLSNRNFSGNPSLQVNVGNSHLNTISKSGSYHPCSKYRDERVSVKLYFGTLCFETTHNESGHSSVLLPLLK